MKPRFLSLIQLRFALSAQAARSILLATRSRMLGPVVVLQLSLMMGGLLGASLFGQEFEAVFLDGRVTPIESFGLKGDKVDLLAKGASTIVERSDLQVIRRKNEERTKPQAWLRLIDGTELNVESLTGTGDRWQVTTPMGMIEVPKGNALWYLMRRPSEPEEAAWKLQVEQARETDVLVIARDQGVLDRAGGEILEIQESFVRFDFDGQKIEAPRNKLLGILWYRKPLERVKPSVRIRTRDGSSWNGVEVSTPQDSAMRLTWKTVGEIQASAAMQDIVEVDFSAANLKWLADLPPIEHQIEPRMQTSGTIAGRNELLRPRFGSSNGSGSQQDLLFATPGNVTFRTPAGFQFFESSVRRASQGDARSLIQVIVWENEKKLWEGSLGPDQDVLPVKVAVQADKKLRLQVMAGPTLKAGCQVVWVQPRFLR